MTIALTGLVLALAASASAGSRAPVPVQPAAVTATVFVASGRGWGHGVGMSQYGALGFANDGWTYDRILAHYYAGAELGSFPVARVRVLVAEARAAIKLRSPAPFRVRDVFGKLYPLPAGEVSLGPKLRLTLNGTPTELAGPLVFLPGAAPLELDRPYRGQLEVGVADNKLSAINVVGLEQYLAGVVAQEMPSSWPVEALKAQAVAARSYALSRRVTGKVFDLYADVRSQVYGGIRGEQPSTTAAIEATKGEVLLWDGKPIDALFHSTSGGTTVDAVEVFGKPVPYLVAADDPHSALSPVHRWGPVALSEAALRKGSEAADAGDLPEARAGPVRARGIRPGADELRRDDDQRRDAAGRGRAAVDVDHLPRVPLPDASRRADRLRPGRQPGRQGARCERPGAPAAGRRGMDRRRHGPERQGPPARAGAIPHRRRNADRARS